MTVMAVERFFIEGYRDPEAYTKLVASPVFPLVRDLEFKFGLKVIRPTRVLGVTHENHEGWLLGHSNGIAVGKAYIEPAGSAHEKPQFAFRSPFYVKERGSSRADRETVRSVKVSSLMATLTRQQAILPPSEIETRKLKQLRSAQEIVNRSIGSSNKTIEFDADEIHALLYKALGRNPSSSWVKVDQNKCQAVLDKYEEADKLRKQKMQESARMFYNPFWMIGVDEFGDYLIGKYKLVRADDGTVSHQAIDPFKRYASYEQVPELVPLMTMVKVAYENEQRKVGIMPIVDKYDTSLDAVFFFNTQPTHYDHAWMLTSCST